jgi:putative component of membrane protein insertase Oxa1/YidC/SpoIIIJ protein YidD
MLIQINYADGRHDYVKDFVLDHLIESKEIARFRRCTGWVTIGVDPVRSKVRSTPYRSPHDVKRISF